MPPLQRFRRAIRPEIFYIFHLYSSLDVAEVRDGNWDANAVDQDCHALSSA